MKAGGAAPSRCRCSSILGRPRLTESSVRCRGRARPDAPRPMAATSTKATQPDLARAEAMPEHRHPLARVVGAAPGGVVAVIGGEEQQDRPRRSRSKQAGQRAVEPFQRAGIARRVAAMAVEAVELDEVGEGQAAVLGLVGEAHEVVHQLGVRLPWPRRRCPASRRCRRSCPPRAPPARRPGPSRRASATAARWRSRGGSSCG